MQLNEKEILREIQFKTSRSGGKGGQNVNKVSTKVELLFNIKNSYCFTQEQKDKMQERLSNQIDSEGFLHIVSQASRSQLENKKTAIQKFLRMLKNSLIEKKKRKATKPTKNAVETRIKSKKLHSKIKKLRGNISLE
jgi:ribosome-associated protein